MKKILIANRGEIAIRIIRAAKEMGIATVAVYSDADRAALHTRMADEAINIGPAPSRDSYLNMDKIIEACFKSGADALHPGYGFLSENAAFAQKVVEAGIIFIGPSSAAMEIMGSKLGAKQIARELGIPLVPGTEKAVANLEEALNHAVLIGFPILIKASAGGGGKGMRIVEKEIDFSEQLELAISEAQSAFGDGSVFMERYIASPRHIEIQVLSDSHGNHMHLFERECSVQRRHQKVIEEAPSVVLSPELRLEMGNAAVKLAASCNYCGAGTVEFIMDEGGNYYFLEMNTRLQVEHPVTEFITGIDLVKEQIRIASGEKISFTQNELHIKGHAIELRVYAENPETGFLPDTGTLETYRLPEGPGVRVDNGMEQGMEVPVYYDPMLAKLIVYAATRDEAIARMIRAIDEYKVSGISTTLSFGRFVMENAAFKTGNFDTHFVKKYFNTEIEPAQRPISDYSAIEKIEAELAACLGVQLFNHNHTQAKRHIQKNQQVNGSNQLQEGQESPDIQTKPNVWKLRRLN